MLPSVHCPEIFSFCIVETAGVVDRIQNKKTDLRQDLQKENCEDE
jgi:hypothetical protein